ncbi:MAG: iron-sulfur cluster repair di-iron protein [Opitutaceae bacterium]|jgi:regulator of cell morphogenesis and NO signaling|nr:iron-sulfur cluster repair di-iron protein [Opitutaceae bacterium]
MKTLNVSTTVGELVRAAPIRARVFEKLGIDYCCGGKKPLAEICAAKGLDAVTVLTMLEAMDGAAGGDAPVNADAMRLGVLCDHIETAHHGYLREELPRLDFMTRKVAAVHGSDEPRLMEIRRVFEQFAPELMSHMADEEAQVFPRIRRLDATGGSAAEREELQAAVAELEREHAEAGGALERFRELTDGYAPPEWACNTFRALYDSLARLERDMHQHVHKENNVLFPRALAAA